jgi:hypothetical protein
MQGIALDIGVWLITRKPVNLKKVILFNELPKHPIQGGGVLPGAICKHAVAC